tara:strand:- start:4327 stop:4605 length:279 start_codon:yes stop_codon:yes gene_type:complete
MSTEWFNRTVGSPNIKEVPGGGYMTVVGTPDWVSLPEQLGGGKARVESENQGLCPCGTRHIVRRLELENGLGVAECEHIGFAWYQQEGKKDD